MRAAVAAVLVVSSWLAIGAASATAEEPTGSAVYAQPDQLWSVRYPADRLAPEALPGGAVAFLTQSRDGFALVESYLPEGDAAGNTGEGFRNRAREALEPLVGPIEVVDFQRLTGPRPVQAWWDAVVSFTSPGGLVGKAYYGQPGRTSGDRRVQAVVVGSRSRDAGLARTLDGVRDSYLAVRILPLKPPAGGPLWAVHSVGMRVFGPNGAVDHFVALYGRDGAAWRPVGRVDLGTVDYLDEAGVTQASVEPGHVWLAVDGGAGAHAGTFHLLSFDGKALKVEVAHGNPSPGAGELRDLLGDGEVEVVLNESDPYVFCYACGVRLNDYRVLRWDGSALVEQTLEQLADAAPVSPTERRANDRAVELARAGLYRDALAAIGGATSGHPTVAWNHALIDLVGRGRAAGAEGYPLLGNLFYGDYGAAVAPMRGFGPADLFGATSPLVAGTSAQDWGEQLVDRVVETTTRALGARPDLAEAYFLRGWARTLPPSAGGAGSPGTPSSSNNPPAGRAADAASRTAPTPPPDPDALADLARAAQLAPGDPLFVLGYLYLRDGALPVGSRQRLTFGAGGTVTTVRTALTAGQPKAFVLRVLGGQRILIDRDGAALLDPDDRVVAMGGRASGIETLARRTGDYTVLALGTGEVEFKVTVPPPTR
jgi:hypothetical protein